MKQLSFSRRLLLGALASALAVCNTGCGNWTRAGIHTAAPSSYQNAGVSYTDVTGNGGFPNDTNYNCVSSPNIVTAGQADPYTICEGLTSGFDISLHGSPTAGKNMVCVFPVDVVSSTEAYADTNTTTGAVLQQCLDMTSGYGTLSFSGARFNGVFVVRQSEAQEMSWCLQNGNYEACPAYSYERWNDYDTGATTH